MAITKTMSDKISHPNYCNICLAIMGPQGTCDCFTHEQYQIDKQLKASIHWQMRDVNFVCAYYLVKAVMHG